MKQIKNEQGFAMVLALLTLVLVAVVGTALIVVSSNVAKTAASERDDQAAFYIAEAAINKEREVFTSIISPLFKAEQKKYEDAYQAFLTATTVKEQNRFLNIMKERDTPQKIFKLIATEIENQYFGVNTAQKTIVYDNKNLDILKKDEKVEVIVSKTNDIGHYIFFADGKSNDQQRKINQAITFDFKENVTQPQYPESNEETKPLIPPVTGNFSVYAKNFTGSNGTIEGSVITQSFTDEANTIYKDNILVTNDAVSSGSFKAKKNLFVLGNFKSTNTFTVDKDLYVNGNFHAENSFNINKNLIVQGNAVHRNWGNKVKEVYINFGNLETPTTSDFGTLYYNKNKMNKLGNSPKGTALIAEELQVKKDQLLSSLLDQEKPPVGQPKDDLESLKNYANNIPQLPSLDVFNPPINTATLQNKTVAKNQHEEYDFIKDNSIYANNYIVTNEVIKLNQSINIQQLIIDENYDLTFDLQGKDLDIVIDNLSIPQGRLHFINGNANLFVKSNLALGGGSQINPEQKSNVNVFYSGTSNVAIEGNQKFYGNLFVKNADVKITASGDLKGDLLIFGKNNLELSGNTDSIDRLLLAPDSKVTQSGSGKVYGNIIANDYKISGGAQVFAPRNTSTSPNVPPPTTVEPAKLDLNHYLKADPIAEQ